MDFDGHLQRPRPHAVGAASALVLLLCLTHTGTERAHGQPTPTEREAILELILQGMALRPSDPCAADIALKEVGDRARKQGLDRPAAIAETEREIAETLCARADPSRLPGSITAADGALMRLVPTSAFKRGSSRAGLRRGLNTCRLTYSRPESCAESWFERETPQRRISLGTFYIDQHEVTNARYQNCVKAGGCAPIDQTQCNLYNPNSNDWALGGPGHSGLDDPRHPVVCATWSEAAAFCTWAGGRLPTEAEWEKAARGDNDDREFPWGDDWRPAGLNWGETGGFGSKDGFETTSPVGAFAGNVSPFGAFDMAGNVWEWTADWHDPGFYKPSPALDPRNNAPSGQRTLRGGSWSFAGNGARTAYRYYEVPETRDDSIGFRCAKDP